MLKRFKNRKWNLSSVILLLYTITTFIIQNVDGNTLKNDYIHVLFKNYIYIL